MREAGWSVQTCKTEADVAISTDYQPKDVVISADSDMMAYETISTLRCPVSRALVLEYNPGGVCLALQLGRQHLTALAVVSSNDYNKNKYIFSLGPVKNYSIIKSIDPHDARSIVGEYLNVQPSSGFFLRHRHVTDCRSRLLTFAAQQARDLPAYVVTNKNTTGQAFEVSLRVFVDKQQTCVPPEENSLNPERAMTTSTLSFIYFRAKFDYLCLRYKQLEKNYPRRNSPSDKEILRLESPRTKSRYRTVEFPVRPALEDDQQMVVPGIHDKSSLQEQNNYDPLPRTLIPKNRLRYSFKRINSMKTTKRPRPSKMKQMKWKPHKESEQKSKPTPEPKPKKPARTLASFMGTAPTTKIAIARCMQYQHPISSLQVGTLAANVKRVLEEDSLQHEVMAVNGNAVGEATRIKCQA